MLALKLSFTTRAIPRQLWRSLYRSLRIVNREARHAAQDCAVFGTGCLEIGPNVPDGIRRVHPANADGALMGET